MIFFTTYVTVIRRSQEWTETRRGTPARVEGTTVRLPIGTDVQVGDHLEQLLANDDIRRLLVVDVVSPYMAGASEEDDYIQVTCVPVERVTFPPFVAPVLHPAMSVTVTPAAARWTSETFPEASRPVEVPLPFVTRRGCTGRAGR